MATAHSFETDAQGNLVGVPTNLKVDGAGNVFDGAGNYVGRAGEVYVDNDGNAVNAAGQIVGFATAGVRAPVSGIGAPLPPEVPASTPQYEVGRAAPAVPEPAPVMVAEPETTMAQMAPVVVVPEPEVIAAPTPADRAAQVLRDADYYRDAAGATLQVPTNLTVDSDGYVHDAQGKVVGRAGEIFVDAHGNAINAAGEVVGAATTHLASIVPPGLGLAPTDSVTNAGVTSTVLYPEGATMNNISNDGTEFAERPFAPNATEGLVPPVESEVDYVETPVAPVETVQTNLFVDENGNVTDADGTYLGRAGEVVADANGNVVNAAGEVVGSATVVDGYAGPGYAGAWPDPRNKYMDGPDGVAQNRYGDGVYGDGSTFASRAFGQNLDTEMLDRDTPDRPLVEFGRNDMGAAGEPVGFEEGAPARANRWQHRAMHRTGGTVATNLTVDADGNVHDADGNYVGKAGEVVAEPDGTVLNAARQVVGHSIGDPIL